MKKEMNNKGFSLVELIIVIAIMAVLVGLLAPQYLKYVNNSKVSADVTNAQALATAFNIAIADGNNVQSTSGAANSTIDTTKAVGVNVTTWPQTKLKENMTWSVEVDANGVKKVTLSDGSNTWECYPNPDDSTNGYTTKNKK